jgi:hypothetical protein
MSQGRKMFDKFLRENEEAVKKFHEEMKKLEKKESK